MEKVIDNISSYGLMPYDEALLKNILTRESRWVDNGLFRNEDKMKEILKKEIKNKPKYFSKKDDKFLLDVEDEKLLFLQFNYCRYRVAILKNKVVDKTGAEELVSWYKKSLSYREILAWANLSLVTDLASKSKFKGINLNVSELISYGQSILLDCINSFDISTNNKFSTYATWSIRREFGKKGEKENSGKYVTFTKLASSMKDDYESLIDSVEKIEDRKESNYDLGILRELIDSNKANLTLQEKTVIGYRYPRDYSVDFVRPTFEALEEKMKLNKVTISKIEKSAIAKLANAFKKER